MAADFKLPDVLLSELKMAVKDMLCINFSTKDETYVYLMSVHSSNHDSLLHKI